MCLVYSVNAPFEKLLHFSVRTYPLLGSSRKRLLAAWRLGTTTSWPLLAGRVGTWKLTCSNTVLVRHYSIWLGLPQDAQAHDSGSLE